MNHSFTTPRPGITATTARRALALPGAALAAALLLTGCSAAPATPEATQETVVADAAAAFELVDGWAKAGEGMTGVFGTITNSGDEDITLESVTSDAAARIELHETITSGGVSKMQQIEGGFVIPAGGEHELVPGGDHIMFMEMAAPLLAGEEIELTLSFDDGSTTVRTVLVKEYDGAQENYGDIEEGDSSGDMDMSDMDMDGMSSEEHAG